MILGSCTSEPTFEEKILGTWTGNLTQLDCCTFDIDVNISSLEVGQNTARGQYTNTNYDICNDDIFFCDLVSADPSNCSFTWRLDVLSDMTITVFEDADENCADGTITLELINDNTLRYRFVDELDPSNMTIGEITKS